MTDSGREFAVLDVREQKEFSSGHILTASCSPLSALELLVTDLASCKKVPVILVDIGFGAGARRTGRHFGKR
ncbi:MAG: rhodanese-like domain-containing protein [Desulfovibrio sp.]|nr:rhodanese-like domain-containing protein [Desulfovibrio sp.]